MRRGVDDIGAVVAGLAVRIGDDPELRARSAQGLKSIGFDGYAVGGLAVGEPQDVMFKVIEEITPDLVAR